MGESSGGAGDPHAPTASDMTNGAAKSENPDNETPGNQTLDNQTPGNEEIGYETPNDEGASGEDTPT